MTHMNTTLTCPYCHKGMKVSPDTDIGDKDDEVYKQQCPHCNNTFTFRTWVERHFISHTASCLNPNGAHEWKLEKRVPTVKSEMVCTICHDKRALTYEEKENLLKGDDSY